MPRGKHLITLHSSTAMSPVYPAQEGTIVRVMVCHTLLVSVMQDGTVLVELSVEW